MAEFLPRLETPASEFRQHTYHYQTTRVAYKTHTGAIQGKLVRPWYLLFFKLILHLVAGILIG